MALYMVSGGMTHRKFWGAPIHSKDQTEISEVICQLSQCNEFASTQATNILPSQELSLNL